RERRGELAAQTARQLAILELRYGMFFHATREIYAPETVLEAVEQTRFCTCRMAVNAQYGNLTIKELPLLREKSESIAAPRAFPHSPGLMTTWPNTKGPRRAATATDHPRPIPPVLKVQQNTMSSR